MNKYEPKRVAGCQVNGSCYEAFEASMNRGDPATWYVNKNGKQAYAAVQRHADGRLSVQGEGGAKLVDEQIVRTLFG